jgi:hypothetical protein
VNDPLEQEADGIAEQIMRMPEPHASGISAVSRAIPKVQRECSCGGTCDDCKAKHDDDEHKRVQRMPVNTEVEVTAVERKKPGDPKDKSVQPYVANIKTKDGQVGWVRLVNLTRP